MSVSVRPVLSSVLTSLPRVTSSVQYSGSRAMATAATMAEVPQETNGTTNCPAKLTCHTDKAGERPEYPWKKAKKVAAMLSFSGKEYFGMQINPGMRTIEGELLVALSKAGAIDPEWEHNPQKAFFQRASRTDKGVSAAKMICSLKMLDDIEMLRKVNENLPADIRLQAVVKVTKNFNCKSAADARTYLYLTPTFVFSPATDIVNEQWRCEPDTIKKVNSVLQHFTGVHYYHNYTSGKLPLEPSAQRYITEFQCGEPFIRDGYEWSVIRVKGQSFMLHQIRKMLGLTFAIVRGHTGLSTLEQTWGMERIDIPRAPGLGLMLEEIHYERYNKRFGDDGIHKPLSWEEQSDEVERFKEDMIFSDIVRTEIETKSMFEWMAVLPMHKFEPRHFESDRQESLLAKASRSIGKEGTPDSQQNPADTADSEAPPPAAAVESNDSETG